MFDKIEKSLADLFDKDWILLAVCLGGLVVVCVTALLISLFCGDFARNARGLKMIAAGKVEQGIKEKKSFAPAFDKTREIAPPAAAFFIDRMIDRPYKYSLLKKLPAICAFATAFFATSALFLASIGNSSGIVLVPFALLVGLVLFVAFGVVCALKLKTAAKSYYEAVEVIKGITVHAGEVEIDKVEDICRRIEQIAVEGGADYNDLSGLYLEIESERKKANQEDRQKLDAALEVLNILIDSAIK